jgi:peptidoglycan/LPS O-acetylase OafA/YrhL
MWLHNVMETPEAQGGARLRSGHAAGAYRPDIDGLRAIAILSVVLFHAGVPLFPGGFTGVDIFFVISGYLIGGRIFADIRRASFSFLDFYRLRAKRILPALYVVLVCTLVAGYSLLSPSEANELGRSAVAAVLSVSNVAFWHFTNYFARASNFNPLLMTWSLGVEEQFYIVVPVLMVCLTRKRRNWLLPVICLLCVGSFLFAWYEAYKSPMTSFYMLPARGWELGVGVSLAIVELNLNNEVLPQPRWAQVAGWILMLVPVFLLKAGTPFPGPAAIPTVVGTALVVSTPVAWMNRRVLSWRPIAFVGKISYSWYLWHWPLLAYLRIASPDRAPTLAIILAVSLSFGLAILSYFSVEQPFRRSTREAAPLLVRYGLVSLSVLTICAVFWLSGGFPARYPKLAAIERSAEKIVLDPCLVKHQLPKETPPCYYRSDPRSTIALWGDSHSTALAPGLRAIAKAKGYGFAQFGKGSCVPLIGAANTVHGYPLAASECSLFNRRVLEIIRANRLIQIVILTGEWPDALPNEKSFDSRLVSDSPRTGVGHTDPRSECRLFIESLSSEIRSLQSAGKKVIVVADVPGFDFDPLSKAKVRYIPARLTLAKWIGSRDEGDPGFASPAEAVLNAQANSLLKEVVEQSPGVMFQDLTSNLCLSEDRCFYRDGDRPFYADAHHLTASGADFAVKGFKLPSPDLVKP